MIYNFFWFSNLQQKKKRNKKMGIYKIRNKKKTDLIFY